MFIDGSLFNGPLRIEQDTLRFAQSGTEIKSSRDYKHSVPGGTGLI